MRPPRHLDSRNYSDFKDQLASFKASKRNQYHTTPGKNQGLLRFEPMFLMVKLSYTGYNQT